MKRLLGLTALAVSLAGCAGNAATVGQRIERALVNAPGVAQPSRVVATELEFARAARDDGQWTAFRKFAASGALIHGRSGPINAVTYLSGLDDPEEAVRWNPRAVWMSCDSLLAVSQGRFRDPKGTIGSFITVWQRQPNGDYRWTYDVAVADDPQPPPRDPAEPAGEDEIVVSALDAVQGFVADCPKRGLTMAQPPEASIAQGTRHALTSSPDGTLRWRWEHKAGTERRFVAEYLTGGQWEVALNESLGLASAPEQAQD